MLVPVVGLLVPWVVSFLKWPSDREARTSTSKGGVIAGLVLLPVAVGVLALMVKATVGLGAPEFEPASARPVPAAKPCTDIGEFLGECKR